MLGTGYLSMMVVRELSARFDVIVFFGGTMYIAEEELLELGRICAFSGRCCCLKAYQSCMAGFT